ncbi:DUF6518 family protein [Streptacidiphilus sp. ASG 303]|uniref:DUF6518 family protein n=1 Tax=Streptacidiphilus sp. ASG 303 TaxID=2896847 RepID=UPI001E2E660D|nr:DUF6518 family protein [Streptacidiphilus sp. ASG 303]MCD0484043.1 DUF6518 family protein [Streptacidiphilus sp. ASG 303]
MTRTAPPPVAAADGAGKSSAGMAAWASATAAALTGGILLGILTNLAQGWLPNPWNQLANSGAVWTAVAFASGALAARRMPFSASVVAGLCSEVCLVVGYYGYAELGRDGMGDLSYPFLWLGMAFLVGPLFGAAGSWWRRGSTGSRRVTGPLLLAGVFGAEGLDYVFDLHYAAQAWACLAVVLLVPVLMLRTARERLTMLLGAVLLSLLTYATVFIGLQHLVL